MKKVTKKKFLKLVIILFILFFLIVSLTNNFYGFIKEIFGDLDVASKKEMYNLLVSSFDVAMISHTFFEFFPQIIVVCVIWLANYQIKLKNSYYIYNVGRNQLFLKKYLRDTLTRSLLLFMCLYGIHLVFFITSMFIYGGINVNTFNDIYNRFNEYSFIPADIRLVVVKLFIHWIPVLIFIVVNTYLIVLLSEFIKNKIVLYSIAIMYFFLAPFLFGVLDIITYNPLFPVNFTSFDINNTVYYAIIANTLSIVLCIILKLGVDKHDKI